MSAWDMAPARRHGALPAWALIDRHVVDDDDRDDDAERCADDPALRARASPRRGAGPGRRTSLRRPARSPRAICWSGWYFPLPPRALIGCWNTPACVAAMMMGSQSRWLSGGVLIAAGLYQLSPLKNVCLAHCRAPAPFLSRHWRPAPRARCDSACCTAPIASAAAGC